MLHEQLKRIPVPRSGTRNGPREKEHTSTANTSGEGAHFNSGYGTDTSGIRSSRTHRTYARKRTKTDRVTAPRYPNRNNTDNRELQIENPQENAQNYGLCLAKIVENTRTCTNHDHATPSPRSSPARAQQP